MIDENMTRITDSDRDRVCISACKTAYMTFFLLTAFPSFGAIYLILRDGVGDYSWFIPAFCLPVAMIWISGYQLCLTDSFVDYRVFPGWKHRVFFFEIRSIDFRVGYDDQKSIAGPFVRLVINKERGRPIIIPAKIFGVVTLNTFIEELRERMAQLS